MRTIITEDWDELEIPNDLWEFKFEYEGLDIPVVEEYTKYTHISGPMNGYGDTGEENYIVYGTIDRWKYTVDVDPEDFCRFLKKDYDDITQADIDSMDKDEFKEYLMDYYEDKAIADAKKNYDYDDVDWEEPLRESKTKKKKDCSSVTYTTGDIGYNISQFNKHMGTDNGNPSTVEAGGIGNDFGGATGGCSGGIGESMKMTEGRYHVKRNIKRYYIKPQNEFLSKKEDILMALTEHADEDCTIYSLKNLDDHDDIQKLNPNDIIYYYEGGILYDKNHVKVLDYDLFVKNEEDRKRFDVNHASDSTFEKEYDDRRTERGAELDDEKPEEEKEKPEEKKETFESYRPSSSFYLDFDDINAYGEVLRESKNPDNICDICGEEIIDEKFSAEPYCNGKCCEACYTKFVQPLISDEME